MSSINRYEMTTLAQLEVITNKLAKHLKVPSTIYLYGDIGSGKTTLVGYLLQCLGYNDNVKSPTYTYVEKYNVSGRNISHFDLYRVTDPNDLEYLGIDDYLEEDAILLFEWPQNGKGIIPNPDIVLTINHVGDTRMLTTDLEL